MLLSRTVQENQSEICRPCSIKYPPTLINERLVNRDERAPLGERRYFGVNCMSSAPCVYLVIIPSTTIIQP